MRYHCGENVSRGGLCFVLRQEGSHEGSWECNVKQLSRRIAGAALLMLVAVLLSGAANVRTASPTNAAPLTSVRLEPRASRVDWSDDPFSVRVQVSDLDHHGEIRYDDNRDTVPDRTEPSEGLGALELLIIFDPAVLEVTDVQAGDFIRNAGRSTQCFTRVPEPGQYALGCASTGSAPGAQGSGTLATVTLTPLANGTSLLGLEGQLAGPLGDEIDAAFHGGVVEVYGGPEVTPTPRPAGPPPTPGGGPSVIGDGDLGDVDLPEGDPGPGASSDDGPGASVLPSTGTGSRAAGVTSQPTLLGIVLGAAGMLFVFLGLRLGAPPQRP